ncbi:MAG: DUF1329 domain-containing protein [Deltaproteobacteria bacterium]|nr:DUF1329 domain-containing protein [Deltaproteobacteria bacterium]
MNRKKDLPKILLGMATVLCGALLLSASSRAEQIRYPVLCYEGDSLAQVRAWEKTWAGQKITSANIEKVKELLPETLYSLLTDKGKWGEYWFEIVPYRQFKPTSGDIKFTLAGKCSIGSDENLVNYVSGIPFPKPSNGLEIAYNYDNAILGDNFEYHTNMQIVDGRKKYNRPMIVDEHQTWFTGRRDVPPVPDFVPNPKDIYHAYHATYHEPPAFKGTRAMTVKWNDRSKDYGSWEFSSSTRRVVRRSTAQRQTHIGPSDITYNDQGGYNWVMNDNSYKLLGRKEMLMPRNQNSEQLVKNDVEGMCYVSGYQRERINMYIIECINKDPNYIYQKEIWCVDPENWKILYADKYDKQGKLWKIFDVSYTTAKSTYDGQEVLALSNQTVVDVQRIHGTKAYFMNWIAGGQGLGLQYDYFSPKALLQYGY